MLLLQSYASIVSRRIRIRNMRVVDARVKLINEILTGIRVIKYYCWEKPFTGKIREVRAQELKLVTKMAWIMAAGFDCVTALVPCIVPLVCFSLYPSVLGKPLSSSVAFYLLSLFKMLQTPFTMFPVVMSNAVQFRVSMGRIERFLNLAECDESIVERDLPAGSKVQYKDINGNEKVVEDYDAATDAVLIRDGYFAWGDHANCLKNITTRIKKGSLVAIVGRVGSGKTSFVSTLVGEMTRNAGVVMVNGSMSLSAQQAWLVNETVKNNILFGKPYDEKKYKDVLHVCCLEDDLKVLQGGSECEIGERGINLSGGQKARISLARCCYSDSDIVVMDDPLAAVDSHVGKTLFHKCIHKYMAGRTRILVTNATQYLHKCDFIIVLDNQTIAFQGSFDQLKNESLDLLLLAEDASSASPSPFPADPDPTDRLPAGPSTDEPGETGETGETEESHLVSEETKKSGNIAWSVYRYYLQNVGFSLVWLFLLFTGLAAGLSVASQFWLSRWSDDSFCATHPADPQACQRRTAFFIAWYAALSLATVVVFAAKSFLLIPGRIRAAAVIHDQLTDVVLAAPVSFHDVTPVGRVLNRFNRDIELMDSQLPRAFTTLVNHTSNLAIDVLNCTLATFGAMLLPVGLVGAAFGFLQDSFRRSNTDIQRIRSLTRSPLFADFQGVLLGAASVRAFACQRRFIRGMEDRLDANNTAVMLFQWAANWLAVRSDVLAAVIALVVAVVCAGLREAITPGQLGIALSACTGMSGCLKQLVRVFARLEAHMNSVERIKEYVDTVQPEPPRVTALRPPPNWPNEGKIAMRNVQVRYRDGPLVLRGVDLVVEPHEKVGIVGRTGAGKSTMMIALFRITELCGGSIEIDGVDLGKLGLEDVRRALCIIPQDPVLFSASIRFNLDPFNEFSDEEIWSVVDQVELKHVVENMPRQLEDDVYEGGANFSVGERQLICIARALLKKPKILIMDEATASLDNETDAFLQSMIRKQFSTCTTLTIAHRLNTIMDADRVCVMDAGVVAEYDTPCNLLHRESMFKGMVLAANDPNLFDLVPGCEDVKKECESITIVELNSSESDSPEKEKQLSELIDRNENDS